MEVRTSSPQPSVERLTRGVMKILDRFAQPEEVNAATPLSNVDNTTKKPSSSTSSYQEFILNLKALAEDSPETLKCIGEFIESINRKPLENRTFDGDDAGSQEECVQEIRDFTRAQTHELLQSPVFQVMASSAKSRQEVSENLQRVLFTKVYSRVFAPTQQHRERDEQLRVKIAKLATVLDPVANLDMKSTLVPSTDKDFALWQKAEMQIAKLNTYKTPHEKLACVQTCWQMLNMIIKSKQRGEQANLDVIIPCMVYLLVRANPPNLHSQVEFIAAHKLVYAADTEREQQFVHFASAVSFLWTCDAKALSMSAAEYDRVFNVGSGIVMSETAVVAPEKPGFNAEWISQRSVFEHVKEEDLKVSDVAKLLAEYKLLLSAVKDGALVVVVEKN